MWILAHVTLGLAVLSWRLLCHRRSAVRRLIAVIGLASLALMVLFGLAWPGLYMLLGALALPGIGMLMVGLVVPNHLTSIAARSLVTSALVLGAVSYGGQAVWMYQCHQIHFVVPDDFSGGRVHGVGPDFEGNIHVWFVDAR